MQRGHSSVLALALGIACVSLSWAAEDDGSQVKILRPENGAVIPESAIELQYELVKGQKAAHAHVYLDGQYQKGFTGTFSNLLPGKHDIRVVAATKDHEVLAAEATITIEVQPAGDTGY
jgi:hypothetical protein